MIPFAVLNPGGRDPEQLFPNGPGSPDDPGHPPVNFHAYAACMQGGFYRDVRRLPKPAGAVLILIRQRVHLAIDALQVARRAGWKVWITFKETGGHQLADFLNDPKRIETLRTLCAAADGCLAATPDTAALFRAFGGGNVHFVPTPYPVEFPEWNFARPIEERRGIWIGTREFDVPSRNHAAAVAIALSIGEPVSVVAADAKTRRKLQAIGPVNIVEGPLPYADYLRRMAAHRAVFQLDRSRVPGQVAGDALLTRTPCIGGDGTSESVISPQTNGIGRGDAEVAELLKRLSTDPDSAAEVMAAAERQGNARLSFTAARSALTEALERGA